MRTIYILTAWNPKRYGCNIEPFKSVKRLTKRIDELVVMYGFNEFKMEKRRVSK